MTKIDKTDRKILSLLESNARMAVSDMSRKGKISRSVVEYRLHKLLSEKVVRGYYALLDPSKFGYTVWKVWLTLRSHKEQMYRWFGQAPEIWWFSKCTGSYDVVLCVLAKTPHQFHEFLSRLQNTFPEHISDSAILINVSFEYHTRGYLLGTRSKMIGTSFQQAPKDTELSKHDIELLKEVSEDSRQQYAQLCQKLDRHIKTIQHRLKELIKQGIIVYYRPSIDMTKVGYEFYKVLVYLHNPGSEEMPSIYEFLRKNGHVVAVISCVGPWQLELEIEIDTYRNLCTLLTELRDEFPKTIKNFDTLLVTEEGNDDLNLVDKVMRLEGKD
ncbi:Lrp/AsnC family transcriptional regulator [Candidatus Woesearchaeota archaeon]|nr:Lrp/AsnC family transcriptional regulator [Candidatus Woesearchaeota archaeon]